MLGTWFPHCSPPLDGVCEEPDRGSETVGGHTFYREFGGFHIGASIPTDILAAKNLPLPARRLASWEPASRPLGLMCFSHCKQLFAL